MIAQIVNRISGMTHHDDLSIVLVGDLVLDVPNCEHFLSGIAPATRAGDLTIGHLEVPHTNGGVEMHGDIPAPGADPKNLLPLKLAGFDLLSLAGNHMADRGAVGIADTCDKLAELGIGHCGAGTDLSTARQAVFHKEKGRTIALLSYNCLGPQSGWAGDAMCEQDAQAGCAYLPMHTKTDGDITPLSELTGPTDEALDILKTDINACRNHVATPADFVIVALHKGIVHTPARLAPYEIPTAHAAIDAGADMILGHHAHIIRGIEFYKNKPIFHGLGNGCVVTKALSPGQDHVARSTWVERRKKLFGFEPDPAYSLAPFHPEAVNAMLGRVVLRADGTLRVGFLPVHIEPPGRPVLADEEQVRNICGYVKSITVAAGLAPIKLDQKIDMIEVTSHE